VEVVGIIVMRTRLRHHMRLATRTGRAKKVCRRRRRRVARQRASMVVEVQLLLYLRTALRLLRRTVHPPRRTVHPPRRTVLQPHLPAARTEARNPSGTRTADQVPRTRRLRVLVLVHMRRQVVRRPSHLQLRATVAAMGNRHLAGTATHPQAALPASRLQVVRQVGSPRLGSTEARHRTARRRRSRRSLEAQGVTNLPRRQEAGTPASTGTEHD